MNDRGSLIRFKLPQFTYCRYVDIGNVGKASWTPRGTIALVLYSCVKRNLMMILINGTVYWISSIGVESID